MVQDTRRDFNRTVLGSLMAYGLIDTVFHNHLFADAVRPVVHQWMIELNTLGRDLKDQKLKDIDFQAQLEALYRRVDLADLVKLIDLDRLTKNLKYPAKGAANLGIDLTKVDGLPKQLSFGKQIFAMNKGRSVVPHG